MVSASIPGAATSVYYRAASLNIVAIDLSKDLDEKVEFTYQIQM